MGCAPPGYVTSGGSPPAGEEPPHALATLPCLSGALGTQTGGLLLDADAEPALDLVDAD